MFKPAPTTILRLLSHRHTCCALSFLGSTDAAKYSDRAGGQEQHGSYAGAHIFHSQVQCSWHQTQSPHSVCEYTLCSLIEISFFISSQASGMKNISIQLMFVLTSSSVFFRWCIGQNIVENEKKIFLFCFNIPLKVNHCHCVLLSPLLVL